jgi:hypothetical protein
MTIEQLISETQKAGAILPESFINWLLVNETEVEQARAIIEELLRTGYFRIEEHAWGDGQVQPVPVIPEPMVVTPPEPVIITPAPIEPTVEIPAPTIEQPAPVTSQSFAFEPEPEPEFPIVILNESTPAVTLDGIDEVKKKGR